MATREELVSALLDDRTDPEPYRVLADWLQAQGDPQGELIAMHLAIDEGGRSDGALMQRADDHLARHKSLQPQLGMWRARYRWKWGLIDAVELDDPSLEDLELVLHHPACELLRKLTIDASHSTMKELLDALEQPRPTIEELALDQTEPGLFRPAARSFWTRVPLLRVLTVSGFGLFDHVAHQRLEELAIENTPFAAEHWDLPAVTMVRWEHPGPLANIAKLCNSELPRLRQVRIGGGIEPGLLEHAPFRELVTRLQALGIDPECVEPDLELARARIRAFLEELVPRNPALRGMLEFIEDVYA